MNLPRISAAAALLSAAACSGGPGKVIGTDTSTREPANDSRDRSNASGGEPAHAATDATSCAACADTYSCAADDANGPFPTRPFVIQQQVSGCGIGDKDTSLTIACGGTLQQAGIRIGTWHDLGGGALSECFEGFGPAACITCSPTPSIREEEPPTPGAGTPKGG